MPQKPLLLFWIGDDPSGHQLVVTELAKMYDVEVLSCVPHGDVNACIATRDPVGCIAHHSLGANMQAMVRGVMQIHPRFRFIEIRATKDDQPRVPTSARAGLLNEDVNAPIQVALYVQQQLHRRAA